MKEYEYLCPDQAIKYKLLDQNIIFLKAIVDPDWIGNTKRLKPIDLKKDCITWCKESSYKDRSGLIIEGNRYYINFDPEHFVIIEPPMKYAHLVSDEYKTIKKFKRKNLEL